MSTRNAKRKKGRLQLFFGKIRRRHVRLDVVDRHQRDVVGIGKRFGKIHAHKQRADEPGVCSHGDRIDIRKSNTCNRKRFLCHRGDRLDMGAARNFGHHAAVKTVRFDLRGHNVGKDLALSLFHTHHGGRGFVTRAFHS